MLPATDARLIGLPAQTCQSARSRTGIRGPGQLRRSSSPTTLQPPLQGNRALLRLALLQLPERRQHMGTSPDEIEIVVKKPRNLGFVIFNKKGRFIEVSTREAENIVDALADYLDGEAQR